MSPSSPPSSGTAILETEAAANGSSSSANNNSNSNSNQQHTYFAPLKTWEFFARTLHLLARRPAAFLTISLALVGVHCSFQWLMNNYLLDDGDSSDSENDTTTGGNNNSSGATDAYGDVFTLDSFANAFVRLANWVLYYLAAGLLDGATVRAVAELYVGEHPRNVTAALAIGTAAQHLVPLVGACLLVTAALLVPLVLLVFIIVLLIASAASGGGGGGTAVAQGWFLAVLGTLALALVVAVGTYHMYPAIIVERRGAVASIRRSVQLTEGHRGEILTVLVLWNAFKFVLTVLVTLIALSISATNQYVEGTLLFLVLVFTSSCGSILKAVVYFHVRIVKEDYKPEDLAAELSNVTAEADAPYERMGQKEDAIASDADPTLATTEGEIV